MNKRNKWLMLQILTTVSYLFMVTINALANILPINGVRTGDVTDAYPNLFAPAAVAFAIWGVIYMGLAIMILYQLGLFKGKTGVNQEVFQGIGHYFWISSFANVAWVISWHYQWIGLSLVFMIMILVSLILASVKLNAMDLTKKDHYLVRVPISIYFGWITVATIANVTVFLVSLGWNGWGLSDEFWIIVAIVAGVVISMTTAWRHQDIAYTLVIIWAYLNILNKHLSIYSATGFDGQYPGIITTVSISLGVIVLVLSLIFINKVVKGNFTFRY